jgi:hypothetical protein
MSLLELENKVSQLPQHELRAFQQWFENYLADQWDRQIEQDAASGKLDRLVERLGIDLDNDATTPMASGWSVTGHKVRPAEFLTA